MAERFTAEQMKEAIGKLTPEERAALAKELGDKGDKGASLADLISQLTDFGARLDKLEKGPAAPTPKKKTSILDDVLGTLGLS